MIYEIKKLHISAKMCCKIIMSPSSETFYLCARLKSIKNLNQVFYKWCKIIAMKKCELSLCVTSRCLLRSFFAIYTKFPFFLYIACLVPKMSNIF